MKIAWYTPFSVDSAIGRFSRLVVGALRGHDVEIQIVRSETKSRLARSATAADPGERYVWAADLQRNLPKHLSQYDLVVYNVGDHYDYHDYCFQHQPQVPGLTILHDDCLHHALHHHCIRSIDSTGQYRDQLSVECGRDATGVYDRLLETGCSRLWWHHEIARFPIYRWAIQNTMGVVTHADFYRQTVASRVGSPTTTIPLAYDTPTPVAATPPKTPQDPLTILTVGAVNANKRYQAVIRAIAESPTLRARCRYRIVGAADSAQRQMIELAMKPYSARPDVVLTGQVTREALQQEFANASIISCLRFPTMEGASASVVEGLLSGKPVIVCDTGCYAEIPDGLTYRVSPEHEHTQLTQALEQIVGDYDSAIQRARRAQKWAKPRHSPDAYAQSLLEFADRVLYNRPVLQLADRIADHLHRWNATPEPSLLSRVDTAMHDLFKTNDRLFKRNDSDQRAA